MRIISNGVSYQQHINFVVIYSPDVGLPAALHVWCIFCRAGKQSSTNWL